VPALVVEGRERAPAEARVVREWLARDPAAAHLQVPGGDEAVLAPPAVAAVRAWSAAHARAAR